MKPAALAMALVLLAGCKAPRVIPLDVRFRPLERIRQADVPGLSDGWVTTIFTEVLTPDMGSLLYNNPLGSHELEALLRHEQVHAVHEFADPILLARYAASADARWSEEKAAYGVQIAYLRANGRPVDVEWLVEVLSGPGYRNMVSRDEARAWVQEQLK